MDKNLLLHSGIALAGVVVLAVSLITDIHAVFTVVGALFASLEGMKVLQMVVERNR